MAYSKEQWERARAYFEAGHHSLSQIEEIIGISKSKISEKSKKEQWERGRNADYIEAKKILAIKRGNEKGTTLEVLDNIADDQIRHKKLINDNATKLANKLSLMTDGIDTAQDLRHLVEANDKLAITLKVADRHAPKTEINNQNNQQNNEIVIEIL